MIYYSTTIKLYSKDGDGARGMYTLPFQPRWTQAHGFAGPHLRIPFRFINAPHGFSEAQEAHIRDSALAEITEQLGGCIEFYDDTKTKLYNDKYILFCHKKDNGEDEECSSALGMVTEAFGIQNDERGKYQEIGIGPGCLTNHAGIQHEMYHALGFVHEMNRNDRDSHVRIFYGNIDPRRVLNCKTTTCHKNFGFLAKISILINISILV